MRLGVVLQLVTLLLILLLLAVVLADTYTYAWNTNDHGHKSSNGGLAACIPWNYRGCSQLWKDMGIHHRVAIFLQLLSIPLIIGMVIIITFSVFTRVIRKRTAIIILVTVSWLVLLVLVAAVVLRIEKFEGWCLHPGRVAFSYHKSPQFFLTLTSLLLSFLITQCLAFGGYFRPIITMLTFDGHFRRFDSLKAHKQDESTVTVRKLDDF